MMRTIKLLGLMALAGLAMSAVFASGAQAEPDGEFKAGGTPGGHTATVITGTQEGSEEQNFLETDSGKTICTNSGVAFAAEDADGTATALTAFASYEECIAGGTNPATVDMNGCHFKLNRPSAFPEAKDETWEGTVDLICPEEEAIEVTIFAFGGTGHDGHSFLACNITVLPKTELGHVTYHNRAPGEETPKDWVTAELALGGIEYVEHGFGCATETELTENGSYESLVKLKGDDPSTEAPDDHDFWIGTESE